MAGDSRKVGIDAFIFMLLVDVALLAGNLFLRVNGVVVCDHAAKDLVIGGYVTVRALHVEFAAHMYIERLIGEVETFVEVAVFDAVTAAAVEVAFAAVLAGYSTDALGCGKKVNAFSRVAKCAFAVSAGICVAGEAVYVFGVGLLNFLAFFPSVTGMAGHAFVFVALRADTEVVDLIDLADGYILITPGDIKSF